MARNLERDAREAERRRSRLIDAGLKLFSEKGIENVSLQAVADEADVGVATLYNYYQTKTNLVIAISASMWRKVWEDYLQDKSTDEIENYTEYQNIETYANLIIWIYENHPEMLKFSGNYKTYICREGIDENQVKEHLDVLKPFNDLFRNAFEKAKTDKSIRTDIPVDELFTTVSLTMLAMAERYASGLVWADNSNSKKTNELVYVKEMLLDWCTKDRG